MSRVQRIRRDLPGRRMEVSSMDKQSFSFPWCFSRHPFSFVPPSLICCRGFDWRCCGIGVRRGKALRKGTPHPWKNSGNTGFIYQRPQGWAPAFTCSFAKCSSCLGQAASSSFRKVLCPGNAVGCRAGRRRCVSSGAFLPGNVLSLQTAFHFPQVSVINQRLCLKPPEQ